MHGIPDDELPTFQREAEAQDAEVKHFAPNVRRKHSFSTAAEFEYSFKMQLDGYPPSTFSQGDTVASGIIDCNGVKYLFEGTGIVVANSTEWPPKGVPTTYAYVLIYPFVDAATEPPAPAEPPTLEGCMDWLEDNADTLTYESWQIADTGDYGGAWMVYTTNGNPNIKPTLLGHGDSPLAALVDAMKGDDDPTKMDFVPLEFRGVEDEGPRDEGPWKVKIYSPPAPGNSPQVVDVGPTPPTVFTVVPQYVAENFRRMQSVDVSRGTRVVNSMPDAERLLALVGGPRDCCIVTLRATWGLDTTPSKHDWWHDLIQSSFITGWVESAPAIASAYTVGHTKTYDASIERGRAGGPEEHTPVVHVGGLFMATLEEARSYLARLEVKRGFIAGEGEWSVYELVANEGDATAQNEVGYKVLNKKVRLIRKVEVGEA